MTIQERIKNHVCCFCEGEIGQAGEEYGQRRSTMPLCIRKSTLEEFFAMSTDDKKAFIAFLRRQLRLEECRKKTLNQLIEKAVAEKNALADVSPFDLDGDPEADETEGVTVGMMNDFREKFSQSDADSRDLMLRGLFMIDQQGREYGFESAELRKKSVIDLCDSLNEDHQEQIWRYIILLLADQENMIE